MSIDLDALRARVRGSLVRPSAGGPRTSGMGRDPAVGSRPVAIVRAADAADVVHAIRAAADAGLALAIGHGATGGTDTSPAALVLDLRSMNDVRVDARRRIARVGGGATWADVDHATHVFGLATTGSVVSTTSVAGHTLGGGVGHLARHHGLSCDNLLSADVVLADGSFVTATEYDHGDLLWALRGGGGNVGVVTSMELQLHRVGDVHGGPILFAADDVDDVADVLRCLRDVVDHAPDELGACFGWQVAPPGSFVPPDRVGDPLCALVTCWTGDPAAAEAVVESCLDAGRVVANHVRRMTYPTLNSAFDALAPPSARGGRTTDLLAELDDEAIAAQVARGPLGPVEPGGRGGGAMFLSALGGAVRRVGTDETAFAHREAKFARVLAGASPDRAGEPDSAGRAVDRDGAEQRERLTRVKARYDPANRFPRLAFPRVA